MKHLLRRGFLLSICKAAESLFGFLFAVLLLWKYGSGVYSDALFGATVLSVGIFQTIPTVMSQILIPSLIATDLSGDARRKFLGSICALSLAVGLVFSAISCIAPQAILAISSPGLQGEAYSHALAYCSAVAPVFLLTLIIAPLQGILHSERRFFSVELGKLAWKTAPIAGILFASEQSLLTVAYSFSVGSVMRLAIVLMDFGLNRLAEVRPCIPKKRYFPHQARKFIGTESLLIAMDWATEIVVRALASTLPVGGLSIFNYTERLCRSLPLQVLSGFGVVLMPELAMLSQKRGQAEKKLIQNACLIATAFGVCAGMVLYLLAPIISVIVGEFSALQAIYLSDFTLCIQMFAPSLVFFLVVMILQSRFFLQHHVKTLIFLNCMHIIAVLSCWGITERNAPQCLALSLTVGIAAKGIFSWWITRRQHRAIPQEETTSNQLP